MKIGYARVSSAGQSLELQVEALTAAGCTKVYQEKESGKSTDKRVQLAMALEHLREGDELVVTRLDRLARSVVDLYQIVSQIRDAGASFSCLQQGAIDTATPSGKMMLGLLGVVAEFEREIILERQREGIARAVAAGHYSQVGRRRRAVSPERAARAVDEHGSLRAAAQALGVSKSMIGRRVEEYRQNHHHERSTDQ